MNIVEGQCFNPFTCSKCLLNLKQFYIFNIVYSYPILPYAINVLYLFGISSSKPICNIISAASSNVFPNRYTREIVSHLVFRGYCQALSFNPLKRHDDEADVISFIFNVLNILFILVDTRRFFSVNTKLYGDISVSANIYKLHKCKHGVFKPLQPG